MTGSDQREILDVDLIAFERGSPAQQRAVVDGTMRSLATGFVYTAADLPERLLDDAYDVLERFFRLPPETKQRYGVPGSSGARGYTGVLVETAAVSDLPDWKEMLNWGEQLPDGHPLRTAFGQRYGPRVLPDDDVAGAGAVLGEFHDRLVALQTRFLRVIAEGIGAHRHFFDRMVSGGSHLTRAIRYPPMNEAPEGGSAGHVWADEHGDINLITALPRATARGLQVRTDAGAHGGSGAESAAGNAAGNAADSAATNTAGIGTWVDASPPDGHVIVNTGIMLEHLTNGLVPTGIHRVVADPDQQGDRLSVVQFCHPTPTTILTPVPSTVTPERPCRFGAISAEDRLAEVLWEINLVEEGRRIAD